MDSGQADCLCRGAGVLSLLNDPLTGRMRPVQAWLPPAFLILLGLGALGIGVTNVFVPFSVQAPSVAALSGQVYADEQLGSFARNPALIRSHAALGIVFVVIASFQFWRGFRNRHRRIHR